jgi:hypothetical protein
MKTSCVIWNYKWDCDKSVARIRLVETENPSACGTVNWKACRIAVELYLPIFPSWECVRCKKSNHPIQNPSYKSPLHVTIWTAMNLRGSYKRDRSMNGLSAFWVQLCRAQQKLRFVGIVMFPTASSAVDAIVSPIPSPRAPISFPIYVPPSSVNFTHREARTTDWNFQAQTMIYTRKSVLNQSNTMENSPSCDADSGSASKVIISAACNPKYNYHVDKSLELI